MGAALAVTVLFLVFVANDGDPPGLLWVPQCEVHRGAGFEIRERDPGGPQLRDGWSSFVPAGTSGEFHLHRAETAQGAVATIVRWCRRLSRGADCVIYERNGESVDGEGRVWFAFARTRASVDESR